MVRLLSVSLAAAALSTGALAADLPVRAPAPAPYQTTIPLLTWTGFYAGVNGGYGWGTGDFTLVECGCAGMGGGGGMAAMAGQKIASTDPSGALLGGQAGYNYQIGSWVIGVEGGVAWSGMKSTTAWTDAGSGDPHTVSTKLNWLASIGPRLGYSFGNTLLYATGGVAWAGLKYGHTHNMLAMGMTHSLASSDTRVGWMVGGGVEYAINANWSAKAEYNYFDFGSRDATLTDGGSTNFVRFKVRDHENIVKVGLNYRFGR